MNNKSLFMKYAVDVPAVASELANQLKVAIDESLLGKFNCRVTSEIVAVREELVDMGFVVSYYGDATYMDWEGTGDESKFDGKFAHTLYRMAKSHNNCNERLDVINAWDAIRPSMEEAMSFGHQSIVVLMHSNTAICMKRAMPSIKLEIGDREEDVLADLYPKSRSVYRIYWEEAFYLPDTILS